MKYYVAYTHGTVREKYSSTIAWSPNSIYGWEPYFYDDRKLYNLKIARHLKIKINNSNNGIWSSRIFHEI
jgi:hypothetical protein